MADSVEQFREEWDETDRLEGEFVERQIQEYALIDVINSGLDWSAEPGNTQSGHAKPDKIAKRLVEAVSRSEVRHGAEIVAKFMRARLEMEAPSAGRNRRKAVLGVIEHACSGERAPVAKLLDAMLQKWERGAVWRDFSDAWIAIHVCRKFDSYDQIAECRDFDAVRRQASGWLEEPVEVDNEPATETSADSGHADRVLPANRKVPAGHSKATDASVLTVSEDGRTVRWAEFPDPFVFTTNQAVCFDVLYRNWLSGAPWLHQSTILDAAGTAPSSRLSTVFNRGKHPAWGTLIIPEASGRKGMFGLAAEVPKKRG